MGLIAGCSFAAYFACSLPAGALATRLGTRRVVGGGLTLAALGLGLTSGASGLGSAVAAQILAGGSAALVIVPVLVVSTAWFHPRSWGLATGVVVGGGGLGVVAAGVAIPALLALDSVGGWRLASQMPQLPPFWTALGEALRRRCRCWRGRSPYEEAADAGSLDIGLTC